VLENLAQVHTHHGCIEKHGEAIDADLGSKFVNAVRALALNVLNVVRQALPLNVVRALALNDVRVLALALEADAERHMSWSYWLSNRGIITARHKRSGGTNIRVPSVSRSVTLGHEAIQQRVWPVAF